MKFTYKAVIPVFATLFLLFSAMQAHAQVDSTGVIKLMGVPKLPAALAGGGAGATPLPYNLPEGKWVNGAPYPLQVTTSIGQDGWGAIYVNGITADSGGSKNGPTKLVAIIPAGATFSIPRSAYVTALANGATWAQTGIKFKLDITYKATFVPPTPDWQSVQDCRLRIPSGTNKNGGTIYTYARFVVSDTLNCASKSLAYFGRLASFTGEGGTYTADPAVGSFTAGSVWRAPYMRDVTQGLNYCTGEQFQNFNAGEPTLLKTVSFRVTGVSQCTSANVKSVVACGSIGCDAVIWNPY